MKRFIQMSLAAFGVLALMLAGCNSAPAVEPSTDGTTMEGTETTATESVEATTGSEEATK